MARTSSLQSTTDNVRMGPLALFTLVTVICLSILAVLSVATAQATYALAQRRAEATTQAYLDERAAQAFVAALDTQLAAGAEPEEALEEARSEASRETDGEEMTVSCSYDEATYTASFGCGNGRHLDIALTYDPDGGLRIEKWRMSTVQNDEPTMGNLLGSP